MLNPFSVAISPKLAAISPECFYHRGIFLHLLFVLGLGTFSHAARYSSLELVWRTNALVSLFQANCHADTVTDTETTPCGSNTTLNVQCQ